MELNGALSNPLTSDKNLQIERVVVTKAALLKRKRAPNRPDPRLPRRQGTVVTAATRVLAGAEQPLRVREIHATVEELLGAPVPYSTVKEALSAHARTEGGRIRRIRRGYYELC
jgi:hypothetical protein